MYGKFHTVEFFIENTMHGRLDAPCFFSILFHMFSSKGFQQM